MPPLRAEESARPGGWRGVGNRSAAFTIVSALPAAAPGPTATLKSPSLFGAGPGRRAPCSSAQAPPRRGPGELPFGLGEAPRSHNAPLVRGKPKWRRAVAKWSVSEAGVRTRVLLPSPGPQGIRCVRASAQGSRWGGCPVSARSRGEAPTGTRLPLFSCMKRLAPLK